MGKHVLLVTYAGLMGSVWIWQANVFDWQWVWQGAISILLLIYFYKHFRGYLDAQLPVVTFTEQGQWSEMDVQHQGHVSNWLLNKQSKITGYVLFLHLVSALNPRRSKWMFLYKDQVSEQDYRRICRAVIFQHQQSRGYPERNSSMFF